MSEVEIIQYLYSLGSNLRKPDLELQTTLILSKDATWIKQLQEQLVQVQSFRELQNRLFPCTDVWDGPSLTLGSLESASRGAADDSGVHSERLLSRSSQESCRPNFVD
jgi:hypothetical protein